MSSRLYGLSAAALALSLAFVPAVEPIQPPAPRAVSATAASFASLSGRTIDLREGWGTAKACHTDGRTTQCWTSEAEMDAAIGAPVPTASSLTRSAPTGWTPVASVGTCSSNLRLYDGASYTGSVLSISTTGLLINLSAYGFDNLTTSYKVGACGATFYESANGGGATYPGSTGAGSQSPSMATGWNNRVSSIYLT